MAFTIHKRKKIQALQKIDVHTPDIDALRNKEHYTNTLLSKTSMNLSAILDETPESDTLNQVDNYFPNRGNTKRLNHFFKNHPSTFIDLIRVVHKFRENNRTNGWYIPDEYNDDIFQLFLFRGRMNDIGDSISKFLEVIKNNTSFIKFCSEQPSILDIGSYDFYQSMVQQKKNSFNGKFFRQHIYKLIQKGLINNIDTCDSGTVENHFLLTKDRIFQYLTEIFGLDLSDISWVRDINSLSEQLTMLFETNTGKNRKRAWKVIQAFHAWGDVVNIEERYAKTRDRIGNIVKKLEKNSMKITDIQENTENNGVIASSGKIDFGGFPISISWRIKTPKSMLKKLWETEEYVRSDYVRDELGISFSYPDDIPQELLVELMSQGSKLLPNKGYILKNKGVLHDEKIFQDVISKSKKKPLYTSHKSGGDPNMKNASQSGFTSIKNERKEEEAIGCEIQYSTHSAMLWKKREDPIYKFRGAIDSLMRGSEQASPKEVFDTLTRGIGEKLISEIVDPDTGTTLGLKSYNDLMFYLIKIGIILPYYGDSNNGTILLFTTKTHQDVFVKKWKMFSIKEEETKKEYTQMCEYIRGLRQTH